MPGSESWYIVAVILAIGACTAKDSSGNASSSAVVASPATTLPNGMLPAGWEQLNSEEFLAAVSSTQWTIPVPGNRECSPPPTGCPPIVVTIAANKDAKLLTAAVVGTNGAVIGKMDASQGVGQTKNYRLIPGNFTYFTVVQATGVGGRLRWKIVQVNNSGKNPISPRDSGMFLSCEDGYNGAVGASWDGCNTHLTTTSGDTARPGQTSPKPSITEEEGWISCSAGCCTLSGGTQKLLGLQNSAAAVPERKHSSQQRSG